MAHPYGWSHRSQSHAQYDSYKRSWDEYSRHGAYYDTPHKRYRHSPPNGYNPHNETDLRTTLGTYHPPSHHMATDLRTQNPIPHPHDYYSPHHPSHYPQPPPHHPHNWGPTHQPPHPPPQAQQRHSEHPQHPPPHPPPQSFNQPPQPRSPSPPPRQVPISPPQQRSDSRSPTESPLSRFVKLGWCGDGTFGKVWSAREIATGRTVALKQIKMNGTEGFPRTAIREIKIMRKALHDNILSITEVVWSESGDVFLVMDYYDYDLRKLLEKHQIKFTPAEVKFLLKQLVSGVKYLHENQLLHRDLKTENILLDQQGHLKICDFGLARKIEEKTKQYTPVVVTLWYRSPELLLGEVLESFQPYKFEIDQWSVGCIFAELVRCSVLFAGTTSLEQIDKIFSIMGTPDSRTWPEFADFPKNEKITFKHYSNRLKSLFSHKSISEHGIQLLEQLLAMNPRNRISSVDTLQHHYFFESPAPATFIDIRHKKSDHR